MKQFHILKNLRENKPGNFKENIANNFVNFFIATEKCRNKKLVAIETACKGHTPKEDIEITLLSEYPKIIPIIFNYKSYFNNLQDGKLDSESFMTRSYFSRILPKYFIFNKIITKSWLNDSIISFDREPLEEIKDDTKYELYAIVGYYGHHYMSFIKGKDAKQKKRWFLCEDAKHK